jgi:ligand-binding sensor domain-containing protein/signal transduction histidine kinase
MSKFFIIALFICLGQEALAQHQPVHIPPLPAGVNVRGLDPTKAITEYTHSVWQTEQGLPQNSAKALCQTRDGYLWIGTDEGLVRFDGVRFTVFDKRTTPSIGSNIIQALTEDRNGALWIGTGGGGITRLRNGIFTQYSTKDGLSNDFVSSFLEDSDGSLWIGTDGGLNRLQLDDHDKITLTTFTTNNGLGNDFVRSLVQDRDGTLWVGTARGVSHLRLGQSVETTYTNYTTINGLSNDDVRALVQDRDGALWIGTGNGLNRLQVDTRSSAVITNYTNNNGLLGSSIRALLLDCDGMLWIGTRGGGISRLNHGKFETYTTQNGLSNDDVRSLLQDREGILWIGTVVGGLNCLRNSAFATYTANNKSNDDVLSVAQDGNGSFWIGTTIGGLRRFDYDNDGKVVFRNYTTKDGLSNNFVRVILQDRNNAERTNDAHNKKSGALWIGTLGGGLNYCRYDHRGNCTFTHYTTRNGLLSNNVTALLHDSDGALWIGTAQGGINRLKNGVFTSYTTKDGLLNNTVQVLLQDHEGALWIGTDAGLSRLSMDAHGKATFISYTTQNGLSGNLIRSLMQDRDGVLWIGTQGGGLHLFKNGKFTSLTTQNGLFDDVVFCILEDNFGYLWMSCNKGVYRTRKADIEAFANGKRARIFCEPFGVEDGMKNAECNGGSSVGWKDNQGRLWFAAVAGVVMTNPAKLYSNLLAPPVIIEEIQADSNRLDLRTASTSQVGVEKLEFHYTATSLLFSGRVKFKFLLEGYDKEWIEAGTRRVAYYTNLPRGRHYRFRVIACNNAGVWNEVGAAAMLYLTPYYWETWQFYTLCAICAVAALYLAVRWRLRRTQARAIELERIVRERTTELTSANLEIRRQLEIQVVQAREIEESNAALQDKNLVLERFNKEKNESIRELETFSYTIAHDLRTPLRAINSFSQIFLEDYEERLDDEGRRLLNTITGSAAKMSVLIDALLAVSRLGRQTLKPITVNMGGIVQAVLTDMNHNQALKEYHIELGDLPDAFCDPALIRQVWSGLLSNAVKYSRDAANKHIIVGTFLQEGTIVYFVRDHGVGFDMRHANKLFQVFQRLHKESDFEGIGVDLTIIHRIIGKHGGKVWAEAAVNQGSTFYFTLSTPVQP